MTHLGQACFYTEDASGAIVPVAANSSKRLEFWVETVSTETSVYIKMYWIGSRSQFASEFRIRVRVFVRKCGHSMTG